MKFKYVYAISILILIIAISGCNGPSEPKTNTTQPILTDKVEIKDFKFVPQIIKIKAGTTVTWIQKDNAPHTITGEGFDSKNFVKGETYKHKFDKKGNYSYICTLHPYMTGKVIVE